jgi:MSHA biogenesis protein MshQ
MGDPMWVEGIIGGALDLDGVDDYVDCGNSELFSFTDAFTLSIWINWRATGAEWQTVIAKGDNAWRLARGSTTQTMDFGFTAGGDRGWQAARTASEVPLGEWHHVAATIDTVEGAKIYLDGVLEGTNADTGGITVGDYPVYIGENAQALNRFWDGSVDDVRLYDGALSGPEISWLAKP